MSGNQALQTNAGIGGTADIKITNHGSNWYFTVCAVMTVATLVFMGWSFAKPRNQRLFHYITATITLVAAIAYFTMGSDLGQTPVLVEFPDRSPGGAAMGGTREFFYVRYLDWVVTTPLLLLDLLLTAGLPWPTIMITILVDEVMIITGLVGALIPSSYKWGYFVFGCLALAYVLYILGFVALKHARAIGPHVSRVYLQCGVLTLFLWTLYPIAWGIAEGGNIIHPDSEAIFYGVLDLLAKPVFGVLLLLGHKNILLEDLGIHLRNYDEPITRTTGTHGEKITTHHHNTVAGNGTTAAV